MLARMLLLKPVLKRENQVWRLTSTFSNLSSYNHLQMQSGIIQYTMDVSECLLITHCKQSFLWTNKHVKDFAEQVV